MMTFHPGDRYVYRHVQRHAATETVHLITVTRGEDGIWRVTSPSRYVDMSTMDDSQMATQLRRQMIGGPHSTRHETWAFIATGGVV